jgi:WD40 repeat protein
LKFWYFEQKTQKYILNTRINTPHSKKLTCIAYSPTQDLLATTGRDGFFKLWELISPESINRTCNYLITKFNGDVDQLAHSKTLQQQPVHFLKMVLYLELVLIEYLRCGTLQQMKWSKSCHLQDIRMINHLQIQ